MGSMISVVSALAFILGLVVLLSRLTRRFSLGGYGAEERGGIRVLARTNLAPRQGVATIEVEGKLMVVSFGDGGVRHVADLDSEQIGARLPAPDIDPEPSGFSGLRGRLSGLRALVLAALLLTGPGMDALSAQVSSGPALDPNTIGQIVSGLTGSGGPQVGIQVGDEEGGLQVSGTVGTVVFIGFMTMIPTLLLLTTSFTRILIVLHLLKQALGTQTAPPGHLLAAMSLLLTGFVMAPTFAQVHEAAIAPWMEGEIDEVQMIEAASYPMRDFMLSSTREQDLAAFLEMRQAPPPETIDDVPFVVVSAAFVTSELTHAFQMGFALFLPFVVIDLVVASVLMSMGMFMLPPVMVSLPFKLLLFVLVDGWALVMGSLVQSFV